MNSELKKELKELADIKSKKSAMDKRAKEIKQNLLNYLKEKGSSSVVVGKQTVAIKKGAPSFKPNMAGVVASRAEQDLIRELVDTGKKNLVSITAKKAVIFGLLEKQDADTIDLVSKHGLKMETKESVEIK